MSTVTTVFAFAGFFLALFTFLIEMMLFVSTARILQRVESLERALEAVLPALRSMALMIASRSGGVAVLSTEEDPAPVVPGPKSEN